MSGHGRKHGKSNKTRKEQRKLQRLQEKEKKKMSGNNTIPMQRPGQQQRIVDISGCENVKCETCQGDHFITNFILKKVSAIISQTGQDTLVPVEIFVCASCGKDTPIAKGH